MTCPTDMQVSHCFVDVKCSHWCLHRCLQVQGLNEESVNNVTGDIHISGSVQPLQDASNRAEEALHWSYPPPPRSCKQAGSGSRLLSQMAKALADVTSLDDEMLDITGTAHSIAVHVHKLLQDPM